MKPLVVVITETNFYTFQVLYWRTVPTDRSVIGQVARNGEPFMRQVFVTWDNPAFTSPEDERIFLEKVCLFLFHLNVDRFRLAKKP